MVDCSRFKEDQRYSRPSSKTCPRDLRICWQTEGRQWRLPRLHLYPESRRYRQLHPEPRLWDRPHLPGQLDLRLYQLRDKWLRLLLVSLDLADQSPTRQPSADPVRHQLRHLHQVLLLVHLHLQDHLLDLNYLVYPALRYQLPVRDYKRCRIHLHLPLLVLP